MTKEIGTPDKAQLAEFAPRDGVELVSVYKDGGITQVVYRHGNRAALLTRFKGDRTWSVCGDLYRLPGTIGKYPTRIAAKVPRRMAIGYACDFVKYA